MTQYTSSEEDYAIGTNLQNELLRRGIDIDKPTLLYGNDILPEETARKYAAAGFTDIRILEGGYASYVETGKETERLVGYSTFVHPDWVQQLIDGKMPETYDNDKFRLVEFSLGSEEGEYAGGHIKGAVNLQDTFNHVPGIRVLAEFENIPMEEQLRFWNRTSDQEIQESLENLGISYDTTVILYATTPATTGAYRAALLMKYAGVEDVRVLNGGKTLWKLQGRELEAEEVAVEKAEFGVTVPVNPGMIYDYEEELAAVSGGEAAIASIRSWEEYTGTISGYTYIGEAGDIANSRFGYAGSDPYSMEDFRNIDNTTFNYDIIKDRWIQWGITPEKEVIFHCGTGWRASETYFYAEALGYEDIHLYDGGWYEWSKMDGSPVMDKGIPADAPEQQPNEFFIVDSE